MYSCQECGKKIKTQNGLIFHLMQRDNKLLTYDERYKFKNYILKNIPIPKCKYCDNDIYVKNWRGSKICNNPLCRSKHLSEIQKEIHRNNPQLAINARERRINYLSNKNNYNSTAYCKRANKQLSFLEQWFYDNVIIKYNLTSKYLIINEYKISNENMSSAYSLDFAFINIKLDVELDGRCHFNHGEKRIETDIIRDNFLLKRGWNIYRISFWDVEHNEKTIIDNFMKLLNNNDFTYDKSYYLRNKVISNIEFQQQYNKNKDKEYIKEQNKQKKLIYINEQRNILKDLEQNSQIDFSKFGWVGLATKYLLNKNIKISQLHRHLKHYYPEFFTNNNVFIRKFHN